MFLILLFHLIHKNINLFIIKVQ